jgi:hypothetical protein
MKSNQKRYTVTEIDLKLRAGYTGGIKSYEDCRVENKILFSVLAEIS